MQTNKINDMKEKNEIVSAKNLMYRYELDNYGGRGSQTIYLRTLEEVKEQSRGEFSLCKDLLTGEVFEPCEIQ